MQNIRVANGHTKKLQKGCAKGQEKEQTPKLQTDPATGARTQTHLSLVYLSATWLETRLCVILLRKIVNSVRYVACEAARAPARCAGKP